jgi:hypothetical protein
MIRFPFKNNQKIEAWASYKSWTRYSTQRGILFLTTYYAWKSIAVKSGNLGDGKNKERKRHSTVIVGGSKNFLGPELLYDIGF